MKMVLPESLGPGRGGSRLRMGKPVVLGAQHFQEHKDTGILCHGSFSGTQRSDNVQYCQWLLLFVSGLLLLETYTKLSLERSIFFKNIH